MQFGRITDAILDGPFSNAKSIVFNGSTSYIRVPSASSFHFNTGASDLPYSISAWIKAVDITQFRIFSKGISGNYEHSCGFTGGDSFYMNMFSSAGAVDYIGRRITGAQTSDQGTWTFFCATYAGGKLESDINLYRNGVLQAMTSISGGTYTGQRDSGLNAEIGRYEGSYADGGIDELSIWSKELSSSEVLEIYNSGFPSDLKSHSATNKLKLWYPMGDGDTYPVLKDKSGNGFDGSMNNMAESDIVSDPA